MISRNLTGLPLQIFTMLFWPTLVIVGFTTLWMAVHTWMTIRTRNKNLKHNGLRAFFYEFPGTLLFSGAIMALRVFHYYVDMGTWMEGGIQQGIIMSEWTLVNLQLILILFACTQLDNIFSFASIQVVFLFVLLDYHTLTFPMWVCFVFLSLSLYVLHHFRHVVRDYQLNSVAALAAMGIGVWCIIAFFYHLEWSEFLMQVMVFIVAGGFTHYYSDRLLQLSVKREQLMYEATYDDLTRTRNWMTFHQNLETVVGEYLSSDCLALVTFDIDRFKAINDTYGHLAGNAVLTKMAATVTAVLDAEQPGSTLYRTGGEEFSIILPGVDQVRAIEIVTACQKAVDEMAVEFDTITMTVTASFGMAQHIAGKTNPLRFFQVADHNLYKAKENGRNLIVHEE